MNILYIAHEGGANFNGASRSLLTLVKWFSKENNVYVVLPESTGKLYEELEKISCTIIVKPFYRSIVYKNRNILRWYKKKIEWLIAENKRNNEIVEELSEFCLNHKIQIIHSNSSVIDIGILVSQKAKIPHVWHFREFGQEDFHMYSLYSKKQRNALITSDCNKIVAVSNAVRDKYLSLFPDLNIETVYNGINMDKKSVSEKKNTSLKSTFDIVIAGVVSKAKGQELAIEATIELLKKGYTDINLYIAGNGNVHELKERYKMYKDNIHFLGLVDDMHSLRKRMDLELVCSKAEAFGRVTIEAMAQGLPVIGTNTGGTPELIEENVTGFLVPYGETRVITSKIEYMYLNKEICDVMGQKAIESVINKFTEENLIQNMCRIYNDVTEYYDR